MTIVCNGYHGTSKNTGDIILKVEYFRQSHGEDEWLGYGIYFFDDNEWYAKWWAKDYKRHSSYTILKATITVSKNNILDLTTPQSLNELDEIAHILIENKKRTRKFADKPINDCTVINYIYNNIKKFDMVMGIFDLQHTRKTDSRYYSSRLRPHQIQLCVRNNSCVSNIVAV